MADSISTQKTRTEQAATEFVQNLVKTTGMNIILNELPESNIATIIELFECTFIAGHSSALVYATEILDAKIAKKLTKVEKADE